MANAIEVKMTGIDDLVAKLDSISQDVRYKGGRFALRKAAQVIRDGARQNATRLDDPSTARDIEENIVERWNGRLFKQTGNIGFRVGVKGGAKLSKDNKDEGKGSPTPHFRLLEFGTEKMPAKPLLRDAMGKTMQAATDTFISEYSKAIDRAIKRAKKTGA